MAADGPLRASRPSAPRRSPAGRRGPEQRRPLTRRPKQLDAEPTLFEASGSGGLAVRGSGRPAGAQGARGTSAGRGDGADDDPGAAQGVDLDAAADPEVVRRARQIAARLAVRRPPRDPTARRGTGRLASARYAGNSDDIDLDATIEALVEHPVPEDQDIVVRERLRTRRSVVLAVDVSGSMRGERIRTAAATVGALLAHLSADDLAVLAFWSDAAVLAPLGRAVGADRLLDLLIRIPARGLTNVAFPLQVARRELARVPARDARVLLLSDCVHNAGPDPRSFAAALPRLDVLLDVSGEHDAELGRELADLGRGRLMLVRSYRDVAPALTRTFTG